MRMRTTIGLSLSLLLVASTAAMAKQTQSAHQQPGPSVKSKPTKAAVTRTAAKRNQAARPAGRAGHRRGNEVPQDAAALPPADQYVGAVQIAGQREIGAAAWYGGRHIGHRMANGERLDAVRATAAHRSLPMHSLVRVTNLYNGRAVIAKITDRGPVSQRLLIDLSPRAADAIDMKRSGIATVSIEPVVPATQQAVNPAAYPAPAAAANPAAYPALAAAVNPAAYPAPAANPAAYPAPSLAVNQAASVAQQ